MEENTQKQSPWISIKEHLPEPHEKVLVCGLFVSASSTVIKESLEYELNQRFTEFEQKRMERYAHELFDKYGFRNWGNPKYEVRYWMPIPDLPKVDKE